uniref:Uncharacterized protein n=1 Tax=Anguilla anguilla TaxID=7936 RepID=A0A0E9S838_ANGAN
MRRRRLQGQSERNKARGATTNSGLLQKCFFHCAHLPVVPSRHSQGV